MKIKDYYVILIILFFGFLFRIYYAFNSSFEYDEQFYLYDSYLVTKGLIPFQDFFIRCPIYIYAQAIFLEIFGINYWAGRLLSVVSSTITISLTYLIAKELYNKNIALLAAFIFAFSPYTLKYGIASITEPLAVVLVALSIYFFILALKSEKNHLFFLSGVLLAVGFYVRRTALVVLGVEIMLIILFNYLKCFNVKQKSLLIIAAGFMTFFSMITLYFTYNTNSSFIVDYLHLGSSTTDYHRGTVANNLNSIFNDLTIKILYVALPTFLFLSSIQIKVSNKINGLYKILFLLLCFNFIGLMIGIPLYVIFIGLFLIIFFIHITAMNENIFYKLHEIFVMQSLANKYKTNKLEYLYKVLLSTSCLVPFMMLTVNFTELKKFDLFHVMEFLIIILISIIILWLVLVDNKFFIDELKLKRLLCVVTILSIAAGILIFDFEYPLVGAQITLLCILSVFSVTLLRMRNNQTNNFNWDYSNIIVMFWFFGLFIFYTWFRWLREYFYELSVVSCIITAVIIISLLSTLSTSKLHKKLVAFFIIGLFISASFTMIIYKEESQTYWSQKAHPSPTHVLKVSQYIAENTNESDEILTAWAGYAFQADRRIVFDISKVYYFGDDPFANIEFEQSNYPQIEEVINYCSEQNIKFIIVDHSMHATYLKDPKFREFLYSEYESVNQIDHVDIFTRK